MLWIWAWWTSRAGMRNLRCFPAKEAHRDLHSPLRKKGSLRRWNITATKALKLGLLTQDPQPCGFRGMGSCKLQASGRTFTLYNKILPVHLTQPWTPAHWLTLMTPLLCPYYPRLHRGPLTMTSGSHAGAHIPIYIQLLHSFYIPTWQVCTPRLPLHHSERFTWTLRCSYRHSISLRPFINFINIKLKNELS